MKKFVSRKNFLASVTFLGFGSTLPQIPVMYQETAIDANPNLVLDANDGEVYLIGKRQGRVTIKVDKQKKGIETMSLLTEDIKPNDGIPVHKHSSEEEFIFIKKGTGILTFGDEQYEVKAGYMALVPRTVWHGLQNQSNEMLRMVFGYTPSGFEDYFRAIGVKPGKPWKEITSEDWQQINNKFGVVYRN